MEAALNASSKSDFSGQNIRWSNFSLGTSPSTLPAIRFKVRFAVHRDRHSELVAPFRRFSIASELRGIRLSRNRRVRSRTSSLGTSRRSGRGRGGAASSGLPGMYEYSGRCVEFRSDWHYALSLDSAAESSRKRCSPRGVMPSTSSVYSRRLREMLLQRLFFAHSSEVPL